jgi:hypothetical protein
MKRIHISSIIDSSQYWQFHQYVEYAAPISTTNCSDLKNIGPPAR